MALFIYLRAAFNKVDRIICLKILEEEGIREGLRLRIEEIYREMKSRVRANGEEGREFTTEKGVR